MVVFYYSQKTTSTLLSFLLKILFYRSPTYICHFRQQKWHFQVKRTVDDSSRELQISKITNPCNCIPYKMMKKQTNFYYFLGYIFIKRASNLKRHSTMQISKITNFYYFLGNIKYSSRELQISRDTQQCKSPKFPNPCNSIQNVVKTDQLLLFFGQYIHQESFKSQETLNNANLQNYQLLLFFGQYKIFIKRASNLKRHTTMQISKIPKSV